MWVLNYTSYKNVGRSNAEHGAALESVDIASTKTQTIEHEEKNSRMFQMVWINTVHVLTNLQIDPPHLYLTECRKYHFWVMVASSDLEGHVT